MLDDQIEQMDLLRDRALNYEPSAPSREHDPYSDEWTDAHADELANNLADSTRTPNYLGGTLEDSIVTRALMAELLDSHRKEIAHYGRKVSHVKKHDFTAQHDRYKSDDPKSANRYFVIFASHPHVLYPLGVGRTVHDVMDYASLEIRTHHLCDLRISPQCQGRFQNGWLAFRSGQYVGIFKTCDNCCDWFTTEDEPARDLSAYLRRDVPGKPSLRVTPDELQ